MQTDKLSHWLQGGALVIGVAALWYARNRVQTVPPGPAATPPSNSPATLSFGDSGAGQVPVGGVEVGGSPLYLTYNYPAANGDNPTGASTAQNTPTNPPRRKSRGDCCCGDKCPQQFTNSGLENNYIDFSGSAVDNLVGVARKGSGAFTIFQDGTNSHGGAQFYKRYANGVVVPV